jgi:hypothetical protein
MNLDNYIIRIQNGNGSGIGRYLYFVPKPSVVHHLKQDYKRYTLNLYDIDLEYFKKEYTIKEMGLTNIKYPVLIQTTESNYMDMCEFD